MRPYHCESLEQRRLLAGTSIFSENFDGVISGWQISQPQTSNVQWAVERSGFDGVTAHSGQFMAYAVADRNGTTPPGQTVPDGTQTDLLHSIDLTGYNNASLSFWYNIPSIGTSGELQVAVDNGSSPSAAFVITLPGPTNGWQQASVDISGAGNESKTLQFYFSGSGGLGAFLDDVEVDTNPAIGPDSTPPTAHLVGTLPDITARPSAPLTFEVEYDDNVAIRTDSIRNTNILVTEASGNSDVATLQSMTINSAGSIDATYSYQPPNNQWNAFTNGAYTLELQGTSIFDSSGNAAAQTLLGSFNVAISISYDSSVSSEQINNSTGLAGSALPQMVFNVSGPDTAAPINYTADIYLTPSDFIESNSPGTLLGQIPFTYSPSAGEITLDPSASGLTVPSNLSSGTYSLGVHLNAPSLYPDTDDSDNWAITGTVTVQPALSNPTIVTVMVLYTPATELYFGSDAAVQQQINTAIATTNTAFLNSDINVQLQLAYAGEVNYSETNPITDLTNLSSATGSLNQVPMLRDFYAADLVSLWTASSTTSVIGEGYVGGSATDQNLGYTVVVASQMDAYTFSHEIGHNFGAGHAVGDSNGENSDNGLYAYSHGWRFNTSGGNEYHDIMAYPPGTTIPYYSNPDIDYLGEPTGTDDANNALTISEDAANVAAYRSPIVPVVSAVVASNASESGHAGDFRITATIPMPAEWPITVNVPLTYAGSPSQSDYQLPADSVSITIPVGSSSASSDVTVTALDDSVYESNEILTVTVGAGDGYTVGQATANMAIADATAPSIASIAPSAASVTRKGAYKITATGVSPGTGSPIVSIIFYRDSTNTGIFSSSDAVIGTDKKIAGGWTISGNAKSLPAGTNTFFAVAKDASGLKSVAVLCTLNVVDNPPTIKKFTASVQGNGLANAVAFITATATDSDGKVTKLVVWDDSNDDGIPDDGETTFTGDKSVRTLLSVRPTQTYVLSAIAYDNDGVASPLKLLTFGG